MKRSLDPSRVAREFIFYRVPIRRRGAEREPIECAIDSCAQESAMAVECADRSFSATTGNREVSFGGLNACCARWTRLYPLPRPKRSLWRGMRADRLRDRFARTGERDGSRMR